MAFEASWSTYSAPNSKRGRWSSWITAPLTEENTSLPRSKGAHLFFLPAYSPDLNPMEGAFSR
jgi:transposase